jgi:putative oxidoreductase
VDVASLVLRVVVGLTIVAHGYNHLFGPGGVTGTGRWFGSMGLRPPRLHALVSGIGELGCGLAFAVGLLTTLAAAFVVGTMAVAFVIAHRRNGFFVFKEGYEYVLMLAVIAVCVALLGPGLLSVDHLIGLDTRLDGGLGALVSGVGGAVGAALLLSACWRPERAAG